GQKPLKRSGIVGLAPNAALRSEPLPEALLRIPDRGLQVSIRQLDALFVQDLPRLVDDALAPQPLLAAAGFVTNAVDQVVDPLCCKNCLALLPLSGVIFGPVFLEIALVLL